MTKKDYKESTEYTVKLLLISILMVTVTVTVCIIAVFTCIDAFQNFNSDNIFGCALVVMGACVLVANDGIAYFISIFSCIKELIRLKNHR